MILPMMKRRYKTGAARGQISMLPPRIEDYVSENAPVRAIDAYVDILDLEKLGFCYSDGGHAKGNGQPPYDPRDHLKLYLYGYLNKVRSSRCLERETQRNVEVMWLLGGLTPNYKTIANFRKDNAEALKAVNKNFISLCKDLNLFGGTKVGIDGSFFHGNASKASIHTKEKLDKQLSELDAKIDAYQKQLDDNDASEAKTNDAPAPEVPELAEKLAALKELQSEQKVLKDKLEASGETQVSTTDEDARLLNKGNGTVAGYNVQIAVDDKHKLIVASDVTNDGHDKHQLHRMAAMAKEELEVEELEALADAGFHEAENLASCEQDKITTYVPEPNTSAKTESQGRFTRDVFQYDPDRNVYVCPNGEELGPRGQPTEHNGKMRTRYASGAGQCKTCPLREKCLSENADIRQIYRSEHEEVVERQRARMKEVGGQKMRERSGLAEHPFGTLKHRAGWSHFLVRGFEKVGGEWAIMATCYNFNRVLNIIGIDAFKEYCLQHQKKRQNQQNRVADQNFARIWSRYFDLLMPQAFRAKIFANSGTSGLLR
jgi:transposase